MRRPLGICFFGIMLACLVVGIHAREGLVPYFPIQENDLTLRRLARPGTPFDKAGRKFVILADESGSFEAWAYPLKLFRNFELSFLVGNSTRPILARDIVRYIEVRPEVTTLTYTYQSFTVKAHYLTAIDQPGALILLEVDSTVPLTIVCGFLPVLQPMWPAGLGGQYAYWNSELKAYVISESTGKNHGLIGSPAGSGISYTPAHMLSDTPSEFKIDIADPHQVRSQYIPIVMAGGKGPRDDVVNTYRRLLDNPGEIYQQAREHYRALRETTLRLTTPEHSLDLAFEWAKIAYDNLLVDNPDLGLGLVAGLGASGSSGRPGFGWFFGGDAYINSFSMNSYGAYAAVRDALKFTQKWQRDDGKMAHELSQAAGYIDWWNDYHYGYIHGDTTPFYITAMFDYLKMSGDTAFVRQSWESLKKAYQWCLSTDADGDGLMDNRKAGLGATEYGEFTGVQTDIYLAAVWVRAAEGMQYLAEAADDPVFAESAQQDFEKAHRAFQKKFWDEKTGAYSFAFNQKGDRVTELSPWFSVGLMWEYGTPKHSLQSLIKLNRSELTTDWGVRSISINSKYYQPLNYNYGAVWPFLTSWVTTAQFKHHLLLQGYGTLLSTARHTFDNALGFITEVFSGTQNIWPQEAVSHQGFSSAGVVLPLVRGLLGLDGDALTRSISLAPQFPANWDALRMENFRLGGDRFDFQLNRTDSLFRMEVHSIGAEGWTLRFAPALGIASRIKTVRVNGQTHPYKLLQSRYLIHPEIAVDLQGSTTLVEIQYEPSLEILPPVNPTRTGERNQGLKIIDLFYENSRLMLTVEGLAGHSYLLPLLHPESIGEVKGAELEGERLRISFQKTAEEDFLSQTIQIDLKK